MTKSIAVFLLLAFTYAATDGTPFFNCKTRCEDKGPEFCPLGAKFVPDNNPCECSGTCIIRSGYWQTCGITKGVTNITRICARGLVCSSGVCKHIHDRGLCKPNLERCDNNGNFLPVQCSNSHCWCVDPTTGNMLPNTKTPLPLGKDITNCDCIRQMPATYRHFLLKESCDKMKLAKNVTDSSRFHSKTSSQKQAHASEAVQNRVGNLPSKQFPYEKKPDPSFQLLPQAKPWEEYNRSHPQNKSLPRNHVLNLLFDRENVCHEIKPSKLPSTQLKSALDPFDSDKINVFVESHSVPLMIIQRKVQNTDDRKDAGDKNYEQNQHQYWKYKSDWGTKTRKQRQIFSTSQTNHQKSPTVHVSPVIKQQDGKSLNLQQPKQREVEQILNYAKHHEKRSTEDVNDVKDLMASESTNHTFEERPNLHNASNSVNHTSNNKYVLNLNDPTGTFKFVSKQNLQNESKNMQTDIDTKNQLEFPVTSINKDSPILPQSSENIEKKLNSEKYNSSPMPPMFENEVEPETVKTETQTASSVTSRYITEAYNSDVTEGRTQFEKGNETDNKPKDQVLDDKSILEMLAHLTEKPSQNESNNEKVLHDKSVLKMVHSETEPMYENLSPSKNVSQNEANHTNLSNDDNQENTSLNETRTSDDEARGNLTNEIKQLVKYLGMSNNSTTYIGAILNMSAETLHQMMLEDNGTSDTNTQATNIKFLNQSDILTNIEEVKKSNVKPEAKQRSNCTVNSTVNTEEKTNPFVVFNKTVTTSHNSSETKDKPTQNNFYHQNKYIPLVMTAMTNVPSLREVTKTDANPSDHKPNIPHVLSVKVPASLVPYLQKILKINDNSMDHNTSHRAVKHKVPTISLPALMKIMKTADNSSHPDIPRYVSPTEPARHVSSRNKGASTTDHFSDCETEVSTMVIPTQPTQTAHSRHTTTPRYIITTDKPNASSKEPTGGIMGRVKKFAKKTVTVLRNAVVKVGRIMKRFFGMG